MRAQHRTHSEQHRPMVSVLLSPLHHRLQELVHAPRALLHDQLSGLPMAEVDLVLPAAAHVQKRGGLSLWMLPLCTNHFDEHAACGDAKALVVVGQSRGRQGRALFDFFFRKNAKRKAKKRKRERQRVCYKLWHNSCVVSQTLVQSNRRWSGIRPQCVVQIQNGHFTKALYH